MEYSLRTRGLDESHSSLSARGPSNSGSASSSAGSDERGGSVLAGLRPKLEWEGQ